MRLLSEITKYRSAVALGIALCGWTASAGEIDYACAPAGIAVITRGHKRVHVKCQAPAAGGIRYFALPVEGNDEATVNRTLSILSTAQVAGRTLIITYDPQEIPAAATGCLANDCRLILQVGFGN